MHERKHLPLRRIPEHRCRCPSCAQARLSRRAKEKSMQAFQYSKTDTLDSALHSGSAGNTKYVAGGTTLIDLMKLYVERPASVVDINRLPLDKIESTSDGGLRIGAMVRNSDLAHNPTVQAEY